MSAFKILKDVSISFEADLRKLSNEQFSVKIGEPFEEVLSKKLHTPEVPEQEQNEKNTLQNYNDAVTAKVLEQQIVKFLCQSHSVKSIITTPDSNLDPEFLDCVLLEKEKELDRVREEWDKELGELKDMRDSVDGTTEMEPGPMYKKLRTLVDKMELMRWLISKLVTSRTGDRYDWLTDPHNRRRALKVAREDNTMEKFLES
ncbi:unnamed protein product [Diatraea saccharalis]|uniref:Uncharacterized protein n=1 Tax=Diatraea saccharalis TaxID=40085 RepID=A0A9N9WFD4_9NEOP|nr:unnamed protein product [Diatraea saccharalis]